MKRFLAGLLVALLLASGVGAGELSVFGARRDYGQDGRPIYPDPLNTGAFYCDSQFRRMNWTATHTFRLKGINFFIGAWPRVIADIGWHIRNMTTGQVIYWTNWDHYANPTQPQGVWWQLPADTWITVNQGDVIQLEVICADYSDFGFPVKAHVAATLYGEIVQ